MNKRGYWLCSDRRRRAAVRARTPRPCGQALTTSWALLASRPACSPAVSPLTYTNSGFMLQSLTSIDVICPVAWAKPAVPTGLIVGELDIEVDWLLPFGVPAPTNACSLSYQSLGGSLTMQPLPVPYPVPANMANMAYGAVVCTVPPWVGIQGIAFNMCVTTPTSPATCPAP